MGAKIKLAMEIIVFLRDAIPFIGSIFGRKARKKAERMEKAVEVVMDGVECVEKIQKAKKDDKMNPDEKVKLTKKAVTDFAGESGVSDILKKKAIEYKAKGEEYINKKVDKIISKWL